MTSPTPITLCIAVLNAFGAPVGEVELPQSERFTLAWTHSVEKTEWREEYRIANGLLHLDQAHIQGSGAGMEPPPKAQKTETGWRYKPMVPPQSEVRITLSPYAPDYRICVQDRCRPLTEVLPAALRPKPVEGSGGVVGGAAEAAPTIVSLASCR